MTRIKLRSAKPCPDLTPENSSLKVDVGYSDYMTKEQLIDISKRLLETDADLDFLSKFSISDKIIFVYWDIGLKLFPTHCFRNRIFIDVPPIPWFRSSSQGGPQFRSNVQGPICHGGYSGRDSSLFYR